MVRTVRNLALVLRPSVLDDLGLIPAINWLAREVSRTSALHVDVATTSVDDDLLDEHRTCVFRIVQEALTNCRRHADARTAHVHIEQQAGMLHLTVSDDGRGFEPAQARGLGVLGMEERVTHLGGRFQMRSASGAGTIVDVVLPLRAIPA
ncbi:MAG TPA: ATP-binding protein, partial [Vicinamibacterales bacterium]|nr:ATP-binding protein [Vicinamibacterales bacterium]